MERALSSGHAVGPSPQGPGALEDPVQHGLAVLGPEGAGGTLRLPDNAASAPSLRAGNTERMYSNLALCSMHDRSITTARGVGGSYSPPSTLTPGSALSVR